MFLTYVLQTDFPAYKNYFLRLKLFHRWNLFRFEFSWTSTSYRRKKYEQKTHWLQEGRYLSILVCSNLLLSFLAFIRNALVISAYRLFSTFVKSIDCPTYTDKWDVGLTNVSINYSSFRILYIYNSSTNHDIV